MGKRSSAVRREAASPLATSVVDPVSDRSIEGRIGRKITVDGDGCWIFDGDPSRYHTTTCAGVTVSVHRWMYETMVGPIPRGRHIHHTCLKRGCCNPQHLVAVERWRHVELHVDIRNPRPALAGSFPQWTPSRDWDAVFDG